MQRLSVKALPSASSKIQSSKAGLIVGSARRNIQQFCSNNEKLLVFARQQQNHYLNCSQQQEKYFFLSSSKTLRFCTQRLPDNSWQQQQRQFSCYRQLTAASVPSCSRVEDIRRFTTINFTTDSLSSAQETKCRKMAAQQLAPTVKLNNGYEMPILGLGTYESKNNEGEIAVKHAIDIGYRHIDTAYFYQNEAEIGKAIRDKIAEGVVKRDEIFLVTKLWNIHHEPQRVEGACRKQLELLGLDYIDLYLMHLPVGYEYVDEESLLPKNEAGVLQLSDVDYLETYKAMEQLVQKGLVRSIGVSNFNSEQIKRVLDNCTIKPVTNQVECSPALNQKKLTKFCKENGLTLTAYSPLGRPKPEEKTPAFYYSDKTQTIAAKYGKTPAQIVLRYLIDIGTIPIPKSSNSARIAENFNIFDFKLTADELTAMDEFHTGERLVPFNLIKGQNHKYFPFNIEF